MMPIDENVLKRLHKIMLLFRIERIQSSLRIDLKTRKGNIELALLTNLFQRYSRTHKSQYIEWSEQNQTIDIAEMKICIYQTKVEFDPQNILIK